MQKPLYSVLLTLSLLTALPVSAERVDHHTGKSADTLGEAVENFSQYNKRLASVLDKDRLTPDDLNTIHLLTYTLENALEKINADLAELAETLESLHVASETADAEAARQYGETYLHNAQTVIP